MYKLLLFLLLAAFFMSMHALQLDEEVALHALFQGKRAVNRAAHAAAQQLNPDKLAAGVRSIDPVRAEAAALQYLRHNLRLDGANQPLPDTFWKTRVDVLDFTVINEDSPFPYTYANPDLGYTVVLNRPGVVFAVRLEYPRTFRVLERIEWEIKGTAELTY